jgi:hypothetical protein
MKQTLTRATPTLTLFGVTDQPYIVFTANASPCWACGRCSSW